MEIKKSDKANLENKRWVGFVLGLIVAFSLFFVAMEYSNEGNAGDDSQRTVSAKNLTIHDTEMLPAIDQKDLAEKKDEEKPTLDDLLNLKRSSNPVKVTPRNAGNINSNDKQTAAPNINDELIVSEQADKLPDPPKVKEVAEKETNKMTDDPSLEEIERYDDKVSKRILSETPTPPGGWVEFMKWLTKSLTYPAAAKKIKKQGSVSVAFIIEPDGMVSDVRIKQGGYAAFEQEALRVLKTMGRWKPGIAKGRPCRSLVEIPIVFSL
ncbi:energy transducer TonB [Prevotella dentasini]|uniref:energy transducer TonB n=1 Tax=Prevotella dentasini TaxID=589537 RepID=UPI00046802E7|nr:energy transducer TonB [Prevotella dentasini]